VTDLSFRYPVALLEARQLAAARGSFRERVRFDLIGRPQHAFGLLAAADLATFVGTEAIVAIEFGVAEGRGLVDLADVAAAVTAETGVAIEVIGLDSGAGLPTPRDYRDHPEIWAEGDFPMGDAGHLRAALPAGTRLVLGPVAETLPELIDHLHDRPVGFVSFDLDLYSSTTDALRLFASGADCLLPVVVSYFDDVLGGPARIGSLFRTAAAGQLLAIEEFNCQHRLRQVDPLRILRHRQAMDREPWLDRMYALHVLDHPLRNPDQGRRPMSMAEHGTTRGLEWPL
jgi:hypothetical protein